MCLVLLFIKCLAASFMSVNKLLSMELRVCYKARLVVGVSCIYRLLIYPLKSSIFCLTTRVQRFLFIVQDNLEFLKVGGRSEV